MKRLTAVLMLLLSLGLGQSPFAAAKIARANVLSQPLAGSYIARLDGSQAFLVATNYEGPPDRAWKMWQDGLFDPGLIEQDFAKARQAGINNLRIFVQSPLAADIKAGKWEKLDTVVSLARKYNLSLIVTFYDYSEPDLNQVAAVDRLVAQRYANESAILGYDLRNEPHFSDLAAATYPAGAVVPLQNDTIIKKYGERVTQAAVNAWRLTDEGKALVPARLSPTQAYYFTNNYRIYLEFLSDAGAWVKARNYNVTTAEYIDSPDSAKWRPLLQALDASLGAWLAPQINAVRSVAPKYPITVGYSDSILAKLSSNSALGFQTIHKYPGGAVKDLQLIFRLLQNLRSTFPNQPLMLGEFGYSNSANSPVNSSIYETALYLYLWKEHFAGGAKWMLNDLSSGWDARQMSFGMYNADGSPKPIVTALRSLSAYTQGTPNAGGDLNIDGDSASGIRYVYSAADALFVGGKDYADQRLKVQADNPVQAFASWSDPSTVLVSTTGPAQVRLSPSALVGNPGLPNKFAVSKMQQGSASDYPFSVDGSFVVFAAEGNQTYSIKLQNSNVDAKIQIVWPQGNLPVTQAAKANIAANLFIRGRSQAICSSWTPTVTLWRSLNNDVEQQVGTGVLGTAKAPSGQSYSVWQFNDVDVSAANDPVNKYYFRLSIDGVSSAYSNVWSHGQDARTHFPNQDAPTGVGSATPSAVDAKIEIVWPQGNLPVNKATKANIAAFLFEQGSLNAVTAGWNPTVRLWRGLNNDPLAPVAVGQKEMKTVGGVTFPTWTFNDVDVSAATDPNNKYYFRVTVDGVSSKSNVWSHGVDSRTYYPDPQIPDPNNGC